MDRKYVTTGGRRIRYLEAGRGDVLVLLHAFPLHAGMWAPQLEALPDGWRLVAPDLRGFGPATGGEPSATGGDTSAISMEDLAADVVDLLDALKIDQAVVGGLSMGGYVSFALLRRAPTYFRGLILADTRPQADSDEAREGRRKMIGLAEREGARAVADDMLERLLGDRTRKERPEVVRRVRRLIEENRPAAIAGALRAMMTRPDSTELLTGVSCPTLVIVGEEDRLTPVSVAQEMQSRIRGARLQIVPAAGHLASFEQPAAFNAALARFLNEHV